MAAAPITKTTKRRIYALFALLALLGLSLRIAAARGGLWLDEAWSAVFARDARSTFDIFFTIHHDNNHYLNTLWLHITGWGAPPLVSRLLSILTGTLTIIVAGLIGLRRGPVQGVLAALFFAISPILLVYGAEARGYAPMFLALTSLILLTGRWLDNQDRSPPSWLLALISTLGMLSHMTMIFGVAAVSLWTFSVVAITRNRRDALIATLHLIGPSLLAAMAILGLGVVLPLASGSGFQVGGYTPFSMTELWNGIVAALEYSAGLRGPFALSSIVLIGILLPLIGGLRQSDPVRFHLCIISLIFVPLLFALSMTGNAGFARYHLLTCFGLLLIAVEAIALGLKQAGWRLGIAAAALVSVTLGCLSLDMTIIRNKRGDPAPAIVAMTAHAPASADVLIGHNRDRAVIEAAAASAGYKVGITENPCSRAQFLFVEEPDFAALPRSPARCGIRYVPVADGARTGLSGMSWRLYETRPKQSAE